MFLSLAVAAMLAGIVGNAAVWLQGGGLDDHLRASVAPFVIAALAVPVVLICGAVRGGADALVELERDKTNR